VERGTIGIIQDAQINQGGTHPGRHNRTRANNFTKSREFTNVIRLIDVNGNQYTVRRKGRMQTTSHRMVLIALLHCAIFGNGKADKAPTHAWSVDDTVMLDTTKVASSSDINALEQEIREFNSITVPEEVLQVHGYAPPKKAEGIVCFGL
jgi:hypothetical protein